MESTRQRSTSREGREVVRWDVLTMITTQLVTMMTTQVLPWVRWRHARQAKQGLQQVWALTSLLSCYITFTVKLSFATN